jgi:hypothetical protein
MWQAFDRGVGISQQYWISPRSKTQPEDSVLLPLRIYERDERYRALANVGGENGEIIEALFRVRQTSTFIASGNGCGHTASFQPIAAEHIVM